jgi:Protein of unknown function (DUF1822)
MINPNTNFLLDFEARLQDNQDSIFLEDESIQQAIQIGNTILNPSQRWQTYLNALALFGFEQWIRSRDLDLIIDRRQCSLLKPQYANFLEGVCNLQIGDFKLCLLAMGTMFDEVILFPRIICDRPEYTAHFYVFVSVDEEQERVNIEGFLSYSQLVERQLQVRSDWMYQIPLTWFDSNIENLLLYLRCLEPTAINLPSLESDRTSSLRQLQSELTPLIPQLQSLHRPLWEILTWEQGSLLLTTPELVNWLYNIRRESRLGQNRATITNKLSQIVQHLDRGVINVNLWLQEELDRVSQNLAWMLIPSEVLVPSELRSLALSNQILNFEQLEGFLRNLRRTGIEIPSEICGGYKDFNLDNNSLRLYALTWSMLSEDNLPEWTLLLILGAQPSQIMPQEIQLKVSDATGILDEQLLEQTRENTYLYTLVIGALYEQFSVAISLSNGETLTLPPFAFIDSRSL